jgi:drug/metabolite transporter (DMT)-like permease
MDPLVFGLVLAAAVLHASWNALVKVGGDPFVRLAVVTAVGGLCALPFLPVVSVPAGPSWPYLIGSVVIHHAYYFTLAWGYRTGDLSHVYPISRGIAPPLVALLAWGYAGEAPGPVGLVGIVIISAGIMSLALHGWRPESAKPVAFGLATGLAIAGYTLCDGLGGRSAGDVFGYIVWLFVIDAIPFPVIVAIVYRDRLRQSLSRCWRPAAIGGALSVVAYAMVIWAMSLSPMASVSALCETSVIIAALIGTRFLDEPFGRRRVLAASVVAFGVVLLQVSRAV